MESFSTGCIPVSPTVHARVVVIGDSTVGKTSLLHNLVSGTFNEHESPTVVSNFHIFAEDVEGVGVELQIWDTAGQEKFRSLAPIYFRNAAAAIAVYDRTSRTTFENLSQWIEAFTEIAGYQTVVAIAGNKLDLTDEAEVTLTEAKEWAEGHNYILAETSALTGAGVQDLFRELVAAILKMYGARRLGKRPMDRARSEELVEGSGEEPRCRC
jgi:small GTP-binding protein